MIKYLISSIQYSIVSTKIKDIKDDRRTLPYVLGHRVR